MSSVPQRAEPRSASNGVADGLEVVFVFDQRSHAKAGVNAPPT